MLIELVIRRYMDVILPTWRNTLSSQSIIIQGAFLIFSEHLLLILYTLCINLN